VSREVVGRHPATNQLLRWFAYEHLPEPQREISQYLSSLAVALVERLPDGPELSTGLRKLLEAKDCFVRASI
jgi:hypothetical protein